MGRVSHTFAAVSILLVFGACCAGAQVDNRLTAGSSYFPLSLGNEWSFARQSSLHTEGITDTATVLGHLYYGLSISGSPPQDWFRVSSDSVYVLDNLDDTTESVLYNFGGNIGDTLEISPLPGCSYGSKIILVSKDDTVIVPSGTYLGCYHFRHRPNCADAGIIDSWFANGVGRIKYLVSSFSGTLHYELDSYSVVTSIDNLNSGTDIASYALAQNYPNPFNPLTEIRYQLPVTSTVSLKVYTVVGQEVATLTEGLQDAGERSVRWNAGELSSGVYFYKLVAAGLHDPARSFTRVRKMVVMK